MARCFACDKPLGESPVTVDTRDGQTVYVGADCYAKIRRAGEVGYQPPKGGPRLWLLADAACPDAVTEAQNM